MASVLRPPARETGLRTDPSPPRSRSGQDERDAVPEGTQLAAPATTAIFVEKLRQPAARGLVRERLERRTAALGAAGPDPVPLGLVIGPPGSGKTTVLSHLAAAAGRAAWYRVGPEDADEAALARHLGHSLGMALAAPAVTAAGASGRVTDLVLALDERSVGPVRLIVDDLHEITGTPAESALETFLKLRPRTVTVLLGSRRPPRINTPRLLVSGELIQLDGEELRFRSWEVEQLFRAVYDAPLSPESAAALTRRTGGWAAGLQLFHLATATLGRVERERAVEELNGRSRLIRSYLARNVLDGLDPDRHRFLLLTCTLGVLTGDLCDALLNTTGSAAVLSELEREQFFTTSTDGGLTYHYHQVLQTHLELLLSDELGGRAARQLYSRSAELLERAGHVGAAVRAHARAEDWGSVGRLLSAGPAGIAGDDPLWGALPLPGLPTDDPGLVLAGARRLARRGQVRDAVAAYRRAEALLDDPEFRRRCTVERAAVAVWLPQADLPPGAADAPAGSDQADWALSVALRRLTRQVQVDSPAARPLLRAAADLLAGDLGAARRHLNAARHGAALASWEPLAERLVGHLLDLATGQEEPGAGQVEEIVLSADVAGWPWLSRLARSLQSVMLVMAAPTPWRVAAADDLLAELEGTGDRWSALLTAVGFGAAYTGLGDLDRARTALDRAEAWAAELGAPVLAAWAALLRTAGPVPGPGADAPARRAAVRRAALLGLAQATDLVDRLATASQHPAAAAGSRTGSAAATPQVQLRCLGGFFLSVDGVELSWRELRPRVQSLLLLLALNAGRPVHRERLVDLLWPDATLAAGIRSLQVAVSSLRHCLSAGGLSEDAVHRCGDAYALQLPSADDQLAEFERLARTAGTSSGPAALATRLAALQRYAGDLLPEVGPAEWVVEERARLRLLAAAVAAAAARDALATDQLDTAVETARRSVALDPYQDSAWALLQDIHSRRGDQSAAAATRRQQAQVWADLGLAVPDPVSESPSRGG